MCTVSCVRRTFKKALSDVILSRRAIRNMNNLYPNATEEELAANDICIICRETMASNCKKLPCNHIFHVNCLRSHFSPLISLHNKHNKVQFRSV